MIYGISLCLFFLVFPILVAVIRNVGELISGPHTDTKYHTQQFKLKKNKIIIELILELITLIILISVYCWLLFKLLFNQIS